MILSPQTLARVADVYNAIAALKYETPRPELDALGFNDDEALESVFNFTAHTLLDRDLGPGAMMARRGVGRR